MYSTHDSSRSEFALGAVTSRINYFLPSTLNEVLQGLRIRAVNLQSPPQRYQRIYTVCVYIAYCMYVYYTAQTLSLKLTRVALLNTAISRHTNPSLIV